MIGDKKHRCRTSIASSRRASFRVNRKRCIASHFISSCSPSRWWALPITNRRQHELIFTARHGAEDTSHGTRSECFATVRTLVLSGQQNSSNYRQNSPTEFVVLHGAKKLVQPYLVMDEDVVIVGAYERVRPPVKKLGGLVQQHISRLHDDLRPFTAKRKISVVPGWRQQQISN